MLTLSQLTQVLVPHCIRFQFLQSTDDFLKMQLTEIAKNLFDFSIPYLLVLYTFQATLGCHLPS